MRRALYWSFVALMLALTGLFVWLGTWQMERLAEKEALIARVTARIGLPPAALPPMTDWSDIDVTALDYAPTMVTGHYLADQAIRVFTAVPQENRTRYFGPGYWLMTPFLLADGGTLLVNRGFIPQDQDPSALVPPAGEITLSGIARLPEKAGSFTPAAEPTKRIDWVRDPQRLAAMLDPTLAPIAPVTLDLPAGAEGDLPQGGGTVVEFPNNHFGYALTWYGFALLTPCLLAAWMWRQRRPRAG